MSRGDVRIPVKERICIALNRETTTRRSDIHVDHADLPANTP